MVVAPEGRRTQQPMCVEALIQESPISRQARVHKKINFVPRGTRADARRGWEQFSGGLYDSRRGYGWLTDARDGRTRGVDATIRLVNGTESSAAALGRPELASWQGSHQENIPLVFRIDLPNGWYRVKCTSVDPGIVLPLVNQRSFKCRAHEVVFAGPRYGAPLQVAGNQLVEGSDTVEVTDGQLRIVIGDPAYAGWVWRYSGPWYKGWQPWIAHEHQYATGWYQKLARAVDPGFHSLRLNSIEVEEVAPRLRRASLIFRDLFNRDDSPDINSSLAPAKKWRRVKIHPEFPDSIVADLYRTSVRITGPTIGTGAIGLLQQTQNPATGLIRYTARMSAFTGEGGRKHKGMQEAGLLLLVEPSRTSEYSATFVGLGFDANRPGVPGRLLYRVGDGQSGYRTRLEIPDTDLPFQIREGEYELQVEHDPGGQILRRISINGMDVTAHFSAVARKQRLVQGLFGIRSMLSAAPGSRLRQFYWAYRVEQAEVRH